MRIAIAVLALSLAPACKQTEKAPETRTAAPGDDRMANAAANCPSTVANATTVAEPRDKDLIVTITATDQEAIEEIQRRATELVSIKKEMIAGGSPGAHDGRGSHKGRIGLCPVHVPAGGTIMAMNTSKGVQITITPPNNLDALTGEVQVRIGRVAEWTKARKRGAGS